MSLPREGNRELRLVLVSFLILFLEIALIRFLTTEIRIFAYVNNLVLLACFLGMGLGCCRANARAPLTAALGGLAATLLLLTLPLNVRFEGKSLHLLRGTPTLLSVFSDAPIWYEFHAGSEVAATLLGLGSTLLVFILVLVILFPLGQLMGGLMDEHSRILRAYSINVAAGLAGLWVFTALSFVSSPPWIWFLLAAALLAAAGGWSRREIAALAALLVAVGFVAWWPVSDAQRVVWSPYQKLELKPIEAGGFQRGYLLNVNNVGYMALLNLSDRFIEQHRDRLDPARRDLSQYDIPYRIQKDAREVLIVGAGGGNDAAGALRGGASKVTAVEIDPGIVALGRAYHPESPYSDRRVALVVDDARAFFKRDAGRYDLISFGLLDAHAQSSSYNNTRLDHYVYTVESFKAARDHLADKGILTVSFESPRPWITGRIGANLKRAFGHDPIAFKIPPSSFGWGGTMFVTARDSALARSLIDQDPELQSYVQAHPPVLEPPSRESTDDWPYLYLERPSIPRLHLLLSGVLLVLFALLYRGLLPKPRRVSPHFFLLGAAFLLLEFQNISKSSLVLGSTWVVSGVTISVILGLILLANLAASRWTPRAAILYPMLLGSILVSYLLPVEIFDAYGYWTRGLLSAVVLNLPIFFAGMVFIESLRRASRKDLALGSNLLGAGVGGLLESLSFVIGIQAQLAVVAVLYALSWAAGIRDEGG
ncbi:MAG TPA: hypothetical protein VFW45_15060 [Candidatus Polarisedimenticolia bacterium]|nr:hypothetical protein [Candidatus Polarisedimenticolia bacterium]